jgi:microcystin-dependent protein
MSEAYLGEIRIFAGPYAPVDWHVCDGAALSINTYQALFTLIGTTYGGDGVNTFKIPDLCGRIPIHRGTGVGLTARTLAQMAGTEQSTLTPDQIPAHNHALMASTTAGSSSTPGTALILGNTTGMKPGGTGNFLNIYQTQTTVTTIARTVQLHANTLSTNTPSGAPHNSMMPSMALTYIICLQGLYPQQS